MTYPSPGQFVKGYPVQGWTGVISGQGILVACVKTSSRVKWGVILYLSGFTFRINARAVICGQTSHQLSPIFRIAAQGGFSENSGTRDHRAMVQYIVIVRYYNLDCLVAVVSSSSGVYKIWIFVLFQQYGTVCWKAESNCRKLSSQPISFLNLAVWPGSRTREGSR